LRKAPPLPFLPGDVHGKEVVLLVTFYIGDAANVCQFGVYSHPLRPTQIDRKFGGLRQKNGIDE